MRFIILSLLLAFLFISQTNTILDTDLWCHFKTGEYIVKNISVPRQDIFSYTLEGKPWIDHEWLSQILLYTVFTKSGWAGINILKVLLISACFLILLYFLISRHGKIIYAALFTLLSILAFGYRSFIRPEIFSYLMLCLFFYMLESDKRAYILPILQILWTNLHGYFILGPIMVFLYCVGELISGDFIKAKRLGMIFIMVSLACFINPYFYKGALYPAWVLVGVFSEQKDWIAGISELKMPVNADFGRYVFFWVFAIASSVTFLLNLKKARMRHVFIFLGAFAASYMAVRNIPIFIFIAMPIAVINLNEAGIAGNIKEKKYYIPAAIIIAMASYFFISDKYYAFTNQIPQRKTEFKAMRFLTPFGACDFLEKNNIKGRIFNTVDFGHYIAYRFYPEKRIFIDTRTELYGNELFRLYQNAENYPGEWEKLQKKYDFQVALIRYLFGGTERLLRYLYNSKEWRLVYYDENSVIFLRDTPENKEAIEKFKIDFSGKKIQEEDKTLGIANFFEKIGESALAEKVYAELLKLNPKFLEAGNNLATIYINTDRYSEALGIIDRLLEYYPKSAGLYNNKGAAYLGMGRIEQGLLELKKSTRLNPYLRQASYMMGLVYLQKGDIDRAMKQFIKYVNLDPYNPGAHRMLGDIYKQKGLLKKAESEYNEADKLEGK
ncbi:MAG: tetratricopeptide repeat protein [Candidatus Omnitrophota bacterium]|nr:tetratricopeptide repeat protein [Candidatus Omnitrophota bacterium]